MLKLLCSEGSVCKEYVLRAAKSMRKGSSFPTFYWKGVLRFYGKSTDSVQILVPLPPKESFGQ
jgi:hypothetical protein